MNMIEHRSESENEDFAHKFYQNNHLEDLGHHLAAIDSAMILLVFTFTPFIGGYKLLTEK